MSQDITIRLATMADASIIVHHRHAMFADMGVGDEPGLDAMDAMFAPFVARALGDGSYRGWLAQTDGGLVVAGGGLLIYAWPSYPLDPRPQRAYILNVYTEPEHRRRGIARRIMAVIIDWCHAERFGLVSLHASSAGRHLYESMGFQPTNEMRLRFQDLLRAAHSSS